MKTKWVKNRRLLPIRALRREAAVRERPSPRGARDVRGIARWRFYERIGIW